MDSAMEAKCAVYFQGKGPGGLSSQGQASCDSYRIRRNAKSHGLGRGGRTRRRRNKSRKNRKNRTRRH